MRLPRWRYSLWFPNCNTSIYTMPPLHMLIVIRPIRKVVLAFDARIRSLPSVLTPVRGQDPFETKTFPAKFASVRRGARVNPIVLLECTFLAKLPTTLITLVRLQPGMN